MKHRTLALMLSFAMLLTGCAVKPSPLPEPTAPVSSAETMRKALIEAVPSLPRSSSLYFPHRLTVTGLGVHYGVHPKGYDASYFFPAVERMTGARIEIDWQEYEGYTSVVAATLLTGKEGLPDILCPSDFGVMELAENGLIVPLDDYFDLMPDILAAVGTERMEAWRAADGHIYAIPSVSSVRGSFSVMVREDWQ
ncbi:MAG: hypothetical protein Q4C53_08005 [Clostridia bacterium]|nr:hypothetical protein [Clostridia bacterium]